MKENALGTIHYEIIWELPDQLAVIDVKIIMKRILEKWCLRS
jgi:hypothetical protein